MCAAARHRRAPHAAGRLTTTRTAEIFTISHPRLPKSRCARSMLEFALARSRQGKMTDLIEGALRELATLWSATLENPGSIIGRSPVRRFSGSQQNLCRRKET